MKLVRYFLLCAASCVVWASSLFAPEAARIEPRQVEVLSGLGDVRYKETIDFLSGKEKESEQGHWDRSAFDDTKFDEKKDRLDDETKDSLRAAGVPEFLLEKKPAELAVLKEITPEVATTLSDYAPTIPSLKELAQKVVDSKPEPVTIDSPEVKAAKDATSAVVTLANVVSQDSKDATVAATNKGERDSLVNNRMTQFSNTIDSVKQLITSASQSSESNLELGVMKENISKIEYMLLTILDRANEARNTMSKKHSLLGEDTKAADKNYDAINKAVIAAFDDALVALVGEADGGAKARVILDDMKSQKKPIYDAVVKSIEGSVAGIPVIATGPTGEIFDIKSWDDVKTDIKKWDETLDLMKSGAQGAFMNPSTTSEQRVDLAKKALASLPDMLTGKDIAERLDKIDDMIDTAQNSKDAGGKFYVSDEQIKDLNENILQIRQKNFQKLVDYMASNEITSSDRLLNSTNIIEAFNTDQIPSVDRAAQVKSLQKLQAQLEKDRDASKRKSDKMKFDSAIADISDKLATLTTGDDKYAYQKLQTVEVVLGESELSSAKIDEQINAVQAIKDLIFDDKLKQLLDEQITALNGAKQVIAFNVSSEPSAERTTALESLESLKERLQKGDLKDVAGPNEIIKRIDEKITKVEAQDGQRMAVRLDTAVSQLAAAKPEEREALVKTSFLKLGDDLRLNTAAQNVMANVKQVISFDTARNASSERNADLAALKALRIDDKAPGAEGLKKLIDVQEKAVQETDAKVVQQQLDSVAQALVPSSGMEVNIPTLAKNLEAFQRDPKTALLKLSDEVKNRLNKQVSDLNSVRDLVRFDTSTEPVPDRAQKLADFKTLIDALTDSRLKSVAEKQLAQKQANLKTNDTMTLQAREISAKSVLGQDVKEWKSVDLDQRIAELERSVSDASFAAGKDSADIKNTINDLKDARVIARAGEEMKELINADGSLKDTAPADARVKYDARELLIADLKIGVKLMPEIKELARVRIGDKEALLTSKTVEDAARAARNAVASDINKAIAAMLDTAKKPADALAQDTQSMPQKVGWWQGLKIAWKADKTLSYLFSTKGEFRKTIDQAVKLSGVDPKAYWANTLTPESMVTLSIKFDTLGAQLAKLSPNDPRIENAIKPLEVAKTKALAELDAAREALGITGALDPVRNADTIAEILKDPKNNEKMANLETANKDVVTSQEAFVEGLRDSLIEVAAQDVAVAEQKGETPVVPQPPAPPAPQPIEQPVEKPVEKTEPVEKPEQPPVQPEEPITPQPQQEVAVTGLTAETLDTLRAQFTPAELSSIVVATSPIESLRVLNDLALKTDMTDVQKQVLSDTLTDVMTDVIDLPQSLERNTVLKAAETRLKTLGVGAEEVAPEAALPEDLTKAFASTPNVLKDVREATTILTTIAALKDLAQQDISKTFSNEQKTALLDVARELAKDKTLPEKERGIAQQAVKIIEKTFGGEIVKPIAKAKTQADAFKNSVDALNLDLTDSLKANLVTITTDASPMKKLGAIATFINDPKFNTSSVDSGKLQDMRKALLDAITEISAEVQAKAQAKTLTNEDLILWRRLKTELGEIVGKDEYKERDERAKAEKALADLDTTLGKESQSSSPKPQPIEPMVGWDDLGRSLYDEDKFEKINSLINDMIAGDATSPKSLAIFNGFAGTRDQLVSFLNQTNKKIEKTSYDIFKKWLSDPDQIKQIMPGTPAEPEEQTAIGKKTDQSTDQITANALNIKTSNQVVAA